MSTNNFNYENILVVIPDFKFDNRCLNEECEHFESEGINCEHVDDCYDYDTEGYNMYVKDIQEQLEKIGFQSLKDKSDYNRNYTGQIIADWSIEDKEGNLKVLEVVIRSGYYDGANIDYNIIDDEYIGNKTLDKKFEAKCKAVEKILRKNGKELTKVAQFSNGEAMYKLKN